MMSTTHVRESAGPPSGLTENPARELANSYNLRVIFFLLIHMPLAYAMASLHAAVSRPRAAASEPAAATSRSPCFCCW